MNIYQYIIVRKDLLKLSKEDLESLSKEKQEKYINELNIIGKMGPGKLSAQVAHASLAPLLMLMRNKTHFKDYKAPQNDYKLSLNIKKNSDISIWLEKSFAKIVLYVKSEEALLNLYKKLKDNNITCELILDEGRTAFKEPTYTCLGIEPLEKEKLKPFLKKLRLLD